MRALVLISVVAGILLATSADAAPPPPSPGLPIGQTEWDLQHNHSMGRQVGRPPGSDFVHFTWTARDRIDQGCICDPYRYVAYNSYSLSSNLLTRGFGGELISLGSQANAGFASIDAHQTGTASVVLHQREYPDSARRAWHIFLPSSPTTLHVDDLLPAPDVVYGDIFWPQVAARSYSLYHVIAHDSYENSSSNLYYWRYDGINWSGPALIDSTATVGYQIAVDATSSNCAILLHTSLESQFNGQFNLAYYESQSDGIGWLNGTELGPANKRLITNYSDYNGPQAWQHITAAYDHDGILHVVFDEVGEWPNVVLRHWNDQRSSIRTVAIADWVTDPNWIGELLLSKVTIGIGDGSTLCNGLPNEDYLYVLYTRLGGPTAAEEQDHSYIGYYNGELYLNVSSTGGDSWSAPVNLTNTKTPNCNPGAADSSTAIPLRPDSVCRSEHWASITREVSDIDILFISDLDAGASPQDEGTWQLNPVHYLRLPGGTADAPYLCPGTESQIASTISLPASDLCGIHASGSDSLLDAVLHIHAFGGNAVTGNVRVVYVDPPTPPADWLSIGGLQVASFIVNPLGMNPGPEWTSAIFMVPTGLTRGTYSAEIRVEQSDSTLPPYDVHLVTFNVAPCACYGDPACDGATNVQDVVAVIDAAFRGAPESPDAFCTAVPLNASGVTDVNCSGTTDVIDVVSTVGVAFRGLSATSTFCSPCANLPETTNSLRTVHRPGDRRPVY